MSAGFGSLADGKLDCQDREIRRSDEILLADPWSSVNKQPPI